ncbi:Gamma-butyrobetaine dioxygenase [Mycobacterium marinum]|nr:TauD/TfdA family dioxygenase [Mycobacterium marinum]AXN42600.1 Gamma-butyrobetaine dioxygenase [Mycobacterium marinum]EPQ72930.1 Taurine catabolism dioxygenase TauD/TfdA [Mycobacterium marinum str. Europe]RFZ06825.1 Gamma-butyrobetaine dioxygenase [Mycobacterium marinum]RFZ08329.1 Gamma-butyrobetaine dioxygenase [Mycobacterium marinum]RFZ50148.1 Gamma-butyrobetaine dioxygenase [Mycobacterium marinum]
MDSDVVLEVSPLGSVRLDFDGRSTELSPWWLRSQCPCRHCRTESGQRTTAAAAQDTRLAELRRGRGRVVEVLFRDGHRSTFAEEELIRHANWREQPLPFGFASRSALGLERRRWEPDPDAATIGDWLGALADNRVLVLEGAPTRVGVVGPTAARIAPVMPTIYGDTWLVRVEDRPVNIAYTACALPFHQDLCAYETPPGLQLLHCIEFDAAVTGGQTWFCDGLAAAERVRVQAPDDFETLCQVWATFATVNRQQHMVVRKPHLVVDDRANLVGINWAPPFEGAFAGDPADEERYRRAYQAFTSAVEDGPRLALRLQPGEIVVFQNRRTLHARQAYTQPTASARRVLEGCYLSADDVANRSRMLARTRPAPVGTGPTT